MTPRITATLAICALAGGIAAVSLFRPASAPTAAPASAQATAEADGGHSGGADHTAADDGAAATPATGADVTIEGFAFAVAGTYAPGQTITVTNADGAPHTMTAVDGSFNSGQIDGGASVQLTLPTTPGTYEFFCAIHPSMTATITIAG
ncbi:MAG: cupredoxin domain-containing protein [Acidimicrobiales bacterium]